MNFQDLQTTKLGNVGEKYISEFAQSKGAKAWTPKEEMSYPVDSICMKDWKPFGIEAKTKPKMKYYDFTGFDTNDYNSYADATQKGFPIYILFIDSITNSIYGNWMKELELQPKKYFNDGKLITFPMSAMTHYRYLSEEEVSELNELSQSKYYLNPQYF